MDGLGPYASPRPRRRFGAAAGPALAKAARRLEVDFATGSTEFRARHPELGGDAVDALAWSTGQERG